MIFQENCFSCYILLTDEISLPDYLYFMRFWAMCVLQLFVNQAVLELVVSTRNFWELSGKK